MIFFFFTYLVLKIQFGTDEGKVRDVSRDMGGVSMETKKSLREETAWYSNNPGSCVCVCLTKRERERGKNTKICMTLFIAEMVRTSNLQETWSLASFWPVSH